MDKNLILENGDTKPQITTFNNETQRLLHKEHDNLREIEVLVYRTAEDRDGYMRTQFVLPEQVKDKVIKQIHSSIYNGNLGKRKTAAKMTERLYRPLLNERIEKFIKTCDTCQKIKNTNYTNTTKTMCFFDAK